MTIIVKKPFSIEDIRSEVLRILILRILMILTNNKYTPSLRRSLYFQVQAKVVRKLTVVVN
jgi:hypothetical protein